MAESEEPNADDETEEEEDDGGGDLAEFHDVYGALVVLTDDRRTAFRQRPGHEFNQGLVFSHRPLVDDTVFEVRIDRKVRILEPLPIPSSLSASHQHSTRSRVGRRLSTPVCQQFFSTLFVNL